MGFLHILKLFFPKLWMFCSVSLFFWEETNLKPAGHSFLLPSGTKQKHASNGKCQNQHSHWIVKEVLIFWWEKFRKKSLTFDLPIYRLSFRNQMDMYLNQIIPFTKSNNGTLLETLANQAVTKSRPNLSDKPH